MFRKYRSKISAAVHEAMQDLNDIGLLEKKTMRESDASCLTAVEKMSGQGDRKVA